MEGRIFVHVTRDNWAWNWDHKSMKKVTDIALDQINSRAEEAGSVVESINVVIINRRTATFIAELKGE